MSDIRFTDQHEWVRIDGDIATIGITDYAQEQLGDVVYVELPEVGKTIEAGDEAAVVESVKAASEVYTPVSGEVIDVNSDIEATPAGVNEDAMGDGWFVKLRMSDPSELEKLMDETAYKEFVEGLH
ncbi:glycine cleavage system protein GcvH [uncultured Parvibaculum sp.]|uniref:glycine cleavage system protein GcvH n=1 Tax=uncultured Parvibaculum sp. TaxID=291828 RepID=UPI0030DBDBA4|tara:strand:- start:13403 stop:13780 length:378 start_codon:yes stop_codon:yes gene_type:complete